MLREPPGIYPLNTFGVSLFFIGFTSMTLIILFVSIYCVSLPFFNKLELTCVDFINIKNEEI